MQLTVLCPLVLLRQHGQENPTVTTLTISHIYLLSAVIWAYVIENLVCVNVSRAMKVRLVKDQSVIAASTAFP